jgi:hypothetical protein
MLGLRSGGGGLVTRFAKLSPMRSSALLAVLVLLHGCAQAEDLPRPQVQVIKGVTGSFQGLAWLPSGWLVTGWEPKPLPDYTFDHIQRFRVDGARFSRIPLRKEKGCRRTHYQWPSALPDGSLGIHKKCDLPLTKDGGFRPVHYRAYYDRYDFDTGRQTTLASFGPGDRPRRCRNNASGPCDSVVEQDQTTTDVSWNPEMTRAVIAADADCEGLAWLTGQGFESFGFDVLDTEGKTHSVDSSIEDGEFMTEGPCAAEIAVGPVTWSPDGEMIAVFVSPLSIGLQGQARHGIPHNLYFLDPTTLRTRLALRGIRYPSSIAWSPDSRFVAFAGGLGGETSDVWIYALRSKVWGLVDQESAQLAWSPDGRSIAGLRYIDDDVERSEVVLYEVAPLTKALDRAVRH